METDIATLRRDSRTLGMFARRPAPGEVKTRLAQLTSPEWAARVASAFLEDLLDRVSVEFPTLRLCLVHTPDEACDELALLTRNRFELVPQGPGDLGERLGRFLQARVERGPVVVIGTDSPTLPREAIELAFGILQNRDMVLGPATDGGFYLIGCRRLPPDLLTGIDWSRSRVLLQTVERIRERGLSLGLTAPWYDIDTLDDWHTLEGHLTGLRLAGIEPNLPRTERMIREGPP